MPNRGRRDAQFRLFDAKFEKSRYAGRQIIEILHKSTQRSFGGPSGGKSDAADPFLIVPRSNFELFCRSAPPVLAQPHQVRVEYAVVLSSVFE